MARYDPFGPLQSPFIKSVHSTWKALFSTWVVLLIVTSWGTKRQRRMNHVHFHTFQSQFNTFNYIIDDYSSRSMCTPDSDNFIYPYWEVVWVTVFLCSREKDGLAAVCSVLWYTVGYLYIWHRVMKKSASANYSYLCFSYSFTRAHLQRWSKCFPLPVACQWVYRWNEVEFCNYNQWRAANQSLHKNFHLRGELKETKQYMKTPLTNSRTDCMACVFLCIWIVDKKINILIDLKSRGWI